jgi:hypothetical protein
MKRIFELCLIFAALFLFSCSKQELKDSNSAGIIINEDTPDVCVKSGILCFKNQSSIEALKQELNGKEYDGLAIWEESIGFNSIEKASSDIMDALTCRAESFVAGGLTKEEVIRKLNCGEIQEVPDEIQQKMDELKLVYKKDKNGSRYIDYSFLAPFCNRFLNEKYEVVVADTLYKYFKDKTEIYAGFSKLKFGTKVEPIIAVYSSVKSDPMLKDVPLATRVATLCFDETGGDGYDHMLTANFSIYREIYQQSGCQTNCVKTQAFAYIYYQGYWHNWFGWHAGTYLVDGNVSFDVWYNENGTIHYEQRQTPSFYHESNSPIKVYYTPVWDNPNYPWIAIGNVDCGMVDMYFDIDACIFNQYNGTDGSVKSYGYQPMSYLVN